MTLNEMLEERAKLVVEKEETENRLKDLEKRIETSDEAILAKFDAEGMSSVKIPGLGNFIAGQQEYFQVPKDRRESAIAAFKNHAPDLVIETINAQTLSAFMRDAKRSGQPLPSDIAENVTSYTKRWISWRRG